jgi:hypothetical protein
MSPYMLSPPPSDSESNNESRNDAQQIVDDVTYVGLSLSDSSELALSKQLEPIAVIGMGQ